MEGLRHPFDPSEIPVSPDALSSLESVAFSRSRLLSFAAKAKSHYLEDEQDNRFKMVAQNLRNIAHTAVSFDTHPTDPTFDRRRGMFENGFWLGQSISLILFLPATALDREQVKTEINKIYYQTPDEIIESVDDAFDKFGKINRRVRRAIVNLLKPLHEGDTVSDIAIDCLSGFALAVSIRANYQQVLNDKNFDSIVTGVLGQEQWPDDFTEIYSAEELARCNADENHTKLISLGLQTVDSLDPNGQNKSGFRRHTN